MVTANGGFEEGLTAWTEITSTASDWQISTVAYAGLQSVQGVDLEPIVGDPAVLISSPVAVEAGMCYRFSLYGRGNGHNSDFGALITIEWSPVGGPSYLEVAASQSEEWLQEVVELVAPAGATSAQLRFTLTDLSRAASPADFAAIWIDEVRIERLETNSCPN